MAILLPENNQFSLKVNSVESDSNGRIMVISAEVESNPLIIATVYAPTKGNIELQNSFLADLRTVIENYSDKPMIIG